MPLPPCMSAPAVTPRHIFYLHGFASSPKSTKVRYFSDRLWEHGINLRCPDFNQPDFSTLTLTRMLGQLATDLAPLDGDRTTHPWTYDYLWSWVFSISGGTNEIQREITADRVLGLPKAR